MFHGTTVGFSVVIDRQSVSKTIVRSHCIVWRMIKSTTCEINEKNALSLCPEEGLRNLVTIRICCLSVLHKHPHMYPQTSVRLDVYSDMFVKDQVLLCVMK